MALAPSLEKKITCLSPLVFTPVRSGLTRAELGVQGLAPWGQGCVCLVRTHCSYNTPSRHPPPGQPHLSWLGTLQPGETFETLAATGVPSVSLGNGKGACSLATPPPA